MKGAPTEADWPSWLLWQVPGPEGVNSAMTIPRRLGSAAVVATQLPVAGCYLPHWPAPGAAGGGDTSGACGLGPGAGGLGSVFGGELGEIGLLTSFSLET
jgi:hypothetical protein